MRISDKEEIIQSLSEWLILGSSYGKIVLFLDGVDKTDRKGITFLPVYQDPSITFDKSKFHQNY